MNEKYYKDADSWSQEIYGNIRRSRKLAWIIASISISLTFLSFLAMLLVLPLKEFSPYIIKVEKSTGYIEVLKGLNASNLNQDEAVTMSNIVRYINARETYIVNEAALLEQHEYILLNSSGMALKQYKTVVDDLENPENKIKKYGLQTTVSLEIKNISFLNETTASVRFLTRSMGSAKEKTNHYIVILAFKYVNEPKSLKDRFINPLGFQVVNYRRDQEIITK